MLIGIILVRVLFLKLSWITLFFRAVFLHRVLITIKVIFVLLSNLQILLTLVKILSITQLKEFERLSILLSDILNPC